MGITDKELLAIYNLSNLKMEFADIVAKYKTGLSNPDVEGEYIETVDRYHTISSLF